MVSERLFAKRNVEFLGGGCFHEDEKSESMSGETRALRPEYADCVC